jgi:hypothetical protein
MKRIIVVALSAVTILGAAVVVKSADDAQRQLK